MQQTVASKAMNHPAHSSRRTQGFTMLEVLISILIIALGLLGLAGLQTRIQQAEFESYQRSQAVVILHDMVDRINANRATASCFAITSASAGTPFYGYGSGALAACGASTSANNTRADIAMDGWDDMLKGAAETKSGSSVGAMVNARGCVSYDSTTELTDAGGATVSGTGIYTITVTWQGLGDTITPSSTCASDQYTANPARRRAISTTTRLATLR